MDDRRTARADVLSVGGKLYVASHRYSTDPAGGYPVLLYRFSYVTATHTYTLDTGFPAFFRIPQVAFPFASSLVLHRDKQPGVKDDKFKVVARSTPRTLRETGDSVDLKPLRQWRPKGEFSQFNIAATLEGTLKPAADQLDLADVDAGPDLQPEALHGTLAPCGMHLPSNLGHVCLGDRYAVGSDGGCDLLGPGIGVLPNRSLDLSSQGRRDGRWLRTGYGARGFRDRGHHGHHTDDDAVDADLLRHDGRCVSFLDTTTAGSQNATTASNCTSKCAGKCAD